MTCGGLLVGAWCQFGDPASLRISSSHYGCLWCRLVRCGGKSKRESSATESIEESATLPLPWIHYAEESLLTSYFSLARKRKTAMVV